MSFESSSSGIELEQRITRTICVKVILDGSATPTLVKCSSDTYDVVPYVAINGVQPSTSGTGLLFLQDAGANFPTLTSSVSPAVWGLLLLVKDANAYWEPTVEIYPSTTSGLTTTITLQGTGGTGVTALKNLAFSFSSAGATLSAANQYVIQMRITYKCLAST